MSYLFPDLAPRDCGRFVNGHSYSPATQFKRGQRTSPQTEFRLGQQAPNKLAIGSVTIRSETHTGLLRAWVKVAEPNVWKKRAVMVWEAHYGPLKRGLVIHHKDRDSLNDCPSNLAALTRRDHAIEHLEETQAWRHGEIAP